MPLALLLRYSPAEIARTFADWKVLRSWLNRTSSLLAPDNAAQIIAAKSWQDSTVVPTASPHARPSRHPRCREASSIDDSPLASAPAHHVRRSPAATRHP